MDIDLGYLTGLNEGSTVTIHRGNSPKYYNESLLWAHIRNEINASGMFDVVKKNPQKDGHLISDPYYLRDRKWKFALTDPYALIRQLQKDFNEGRCVLMIHRLTD